MKPNATTSTEGPTADDIEGHTDPVPAEPDPAPAEPAAVPAATPTSNPAPTEAANAVAFVRAEATELATIGAQAARLGLNIDVAEAVQKGIKPDAMRASVLNQLAALSDAAAIVLVPPPKSAAPESPIIAAAKKAAADAKR